MVKPCGMHPSHLTTDAIWADGAATLVDPRGDSQAFLQTAARHAEAACLSRQDQNESLSELSLVRLADS